MPELLKIDVSPRGDHSLSRRLGKQFADQWLQSHSGYKIVGRDLAKTSLPFVDLPWIAGAFTAPDQHTAEHKSALKLSDELVAELLAADEIVITTPMYNFNVPAVLKAWIDHIVRVGVTFSVGPDGFKGLVSGKKVTVILASGGAYPVGTPYEAYNAESPYLRQILGFIGVTDLTFVQAGGTNDVAQGKITSEDFIAKFTPEVHAAAK
jgi:FMN-dependent NADH-azoreductase